MKLVMLLALATLALLACAAPTPTATPTRAVTPTPTPTPTPPEAARELGTLEVRVTDQPDHDVTKIEVTASQIRVHRAGEAEAEDVGWQTVVEEEMTFDLLGVVGIEAILGSAELEAGTYSQVRLEVVRVLVTLDGEDQEATVPSGEIKIVRPIRVEAGETTIATLDFDADASVTVTGNNRVIFRPVVRLMVRKGGEPFVPAGEVTPPPEEPTPTPTEEVAAEELFLNILSPEEEEEVVSEPVITVVGRTLPDAVVSVGDTVVEPDSEGRFEHQVELVEGPNTIEVVVSDVGGEQLGVVLTVIYAPAS
ncbi:MAG: DUF4382 domain-containing protein, partial [Dehalococcoidia bacterium]